MAVAVGMGVSVGTGDGEAVAVDVGGRGVIVGGSGVLVGAVVAVEVCPADAPDSASAPRFAVLHPVKANTTRMMRINPAIPWLCFDIMTLFVIGNKVPKWIRPIDIEICRFSSKLLGSRPYLGFYPGIITVIPGRPVFSGQPYGEKSA